MRVEYEELIRAHQAVCLMGNSGLGDVIAVYKQKLMELRFLLEELKEGKGETNKNREGQEQVSYFYISIRDAG